MLIRRKTKSRKLYKQKRRFAVGQTSAFQTTAAVKGQ